MQVWFTAQELADASAEGLFPALPCTKMGIHKLASREKWDRHPSLSRLRAGREGGGGNEYHIELLALPIRLSYIARHFSASGAGMSPPPMDGVAATSKAQLARDARFAMLRIIESFRRTLGMAQKTVDTYFALLFNAGSIEVPGWIRDEIGTVSARTIARWRGTSREDVNALAYDPGLARKGTGVLDAANGGAVRAFILGLIAHQPHLFAPEIRDICRDEFGDTLKVVSKGVETAVPMPPVRTFQHVLKRLKAEHKVELLKLTNPDLYRSTMAPSGVGMLRHVTEPNQMWQIDASPVDALCVDGRHSVYACIDIATRRIILLLSRTPRASAVALLIRKAIMTWGVPDLVKTDNGSDFTARETQRLFVSLGIETMLSDPYQPQQKGHIERAIGTFQRKVGPLLPGFIGHSVADRKAIESRKSFAARLGESDADTFGVTLTGPQLQTHIDQWSFEIYQHEPHSGIGNRSPFQAAAASAKPIRRVEERALDLLLMPVADGGGRRTVTKFGVRVGGHHYMTPTILPGTVVFVRQDPLDLGRAYAFSEDGAQFLAEARCPELAGIDPVAFVREAKALQRELVEELSKPIRDEARRIAKGPALFDRVLATKRRDAPNVIALPKREERHSTPQIAAALDAVATQPPAARELSPHEAAEHRRLIERMQAEENAELRQRTDAIVERRIEEIEAARVAHLPPTVTVLPESPKERYRRACHFRQLLEQGQLDGADGLWLGRYEQSAEFKAHAKIHEDFGDAYLS